MQFNKAPMKGKVLLTLPAGPVVGNDVTPEHIHLRATYADLTLCRHLQHNITPNVSQAQSGFFPPLFCRYSYLKWCVGFFFSSAFFIIQRFDILLFLDHTLTTKLLSFPLSPQILSNISQNKSNALQPKHPPPPFPVTLTSGQTRSIFRRPPAPRQLIDGGRKTTWGLLITLSPRFNGWSLCFLLAPQVHRAKTPRLRWNDGQVSDLKVHSWCRYWETTVKFLPQLVKVPVKTCFSRCSLTGE